jgi:hypothetical protein
MPTVTTPTHPDSPEHAYVISRRIRAFALAITSVSCVWALITGYLWLTGEAKWIYFLGALPTAMCTLLSTYYAFTSRLVLSPDGIHYKSYGASYFVRWDSVKQFSTRRWSWRKGLTLSQPIQPKITTLIGYLLIPRPLSFIPLQQFVSPTHQWRADIARYTPHLLADSLASCSQDAGK